MNKSTLTDPQFYALRALIETYHRSENSLPLPFSLWTQLLYLVPQGYTRRTYRALEVKNPPLIERDPLNENSIRPTLLGVRTYQEAQNKRGAK